MKKDAGFGRNFEHPRSERGRTLRFRALLLQHFRKIATSHEPVHSHLPTHPKYFTLHLESEPQKKLTKIWRRWQQRLRHWYSDRILHKLKRNLKCR